MSRKKPLSQHIPPKRKNTAGNHIRIIAGQWRGRRLPVLDAPGLRPTKDAVRETLFNWLAPEINHAICLDCFAGTGALGIEAASRGAAQVILVEKDRANTKQLEANVNRLEASNISVANTDALSFIQQLDTTIDIAFLDPPFDLDVLDQLLPELVGKMHEEGAIYIEQDRNKGLPALPVGWYYRREKNAGQVVFGLAVRS